MVVELDSLLGHGGLGGEAAGRDPLGPEACWRLACDGAVTRASARPLSAPPLPSATTAVPSPTA
ncbi:MAG TPA: hypothetical protein VFJ69_07135, partial [Actinomycetota bacterium]|nr:hypothetical protein [Actinomycetota bacterium]